jgi:hypothetical protein
MHAGEAHPAGFLRSDTGRVGDVNRLTQTCYGSLLALVSTLTTHFFLQGSTWCYD